MAWLIVILIVGGISVIAYGLTLLGIGIGFMSLISFLSNIFGSWGGIFILTEGLILLVLAPTILIDWDKDDKEDNK